MEREFNEQFNTAVEFNNDASEPPKGKNIDFVAKISFALHAMESAIAGLTNGKEASEIIIPEEITLKTLLNAASYIYHMDEVKDSLANVSTPLSKN